MRTRASPLRLKLTIWFVLVFALIQGVFVVTVVLFRREVIQRDFDTSLKSSANEMIDSLLSSGVEWEEEAVGSLIPSGAKFLFVALRSPDGEAIALWNVEEESKIPFGFNEVVPTGPQGPVLTPIGPDIALELTREPFRLRLITVPFRFREQDFYFQAAVTDSVSETVLGPFQDLVAVGVPVGVLAACIAAWVIAGRVVAPIRSLSLAATRVSPERLDERFRVSTTDVEISHLEKELNSALQRLEEGYSAQRQFMSNVSHELKTPIAVLLTKAQVAKMGTMTMERASSFVLAAEREMQRLGRLVESFLTLARADSPHRLPEYPVPILDLVLESLQHSRPLAEAHKIRLIPHLAEATLPGEVDELEVAGDVGLLQSAVDNLIRNAIQHSPAGETVEIEVSSHEGKVLITVSDHGPGIPADYASTIFDRFKQVPGRASPGGSGLGLAITKHVVELHGGSVSLNSGVGCSITITLPMMIVEA